jgi:DNA-nicking Smr family endonuclease
MKFHVGDKVSFLNEKGEGIVSKIINKKMVSVTVEHGFEFPYIASELILLEAAEIIEEEPLPEPPEEEAKIDISLLFQKKMHSDKPKKSKPHAQNNGLLEMEINLHIEELIDDYRGMSNAQIIQVQLKHFQKALDKAIMDHYRKLVVIHGVGNGRLKQEVRAILAAESHVRFYDASYSKYGFGATEIYID